MAELKVTKNVDYKVMEEIIEMGEESIIKTLINFK